MFQFIKKNREKVYSMNLEESKNQNVDLFQKNFLLILKDSAKTITNLQIPPFIFMEKIELTNFRPSITQLEKTARILKQARSLKQIHFEHPVE